MKRISTAILTLLMASVITACDDDDNNTSTTATTKSQTSLRVIHGSSDAPKVNILAGGNAITGLTNVDYQQGSGFLKLDAGNYPVTVDAILADASTTQVLNLGNLDLKADTEYTVVAHGLVTADDNSNNDLATAIIANNKSDVGDGNIRLQVLHASPTAPSVDLHVTAANADLGAPLGTLAYGDVTGQVEVPAGIYRVRLVISAGEAGAGTLAYDKVLPDLAAGSDLFVAAVPNVGVTTSPVVLLVNDGSSTSTLIDDRTQTWLRVAHTAADVPNVDILANGGKIDALSNAPFTGATNYTPVAAASYKVDTVLTADNSVVGISSDVDLMIGKKYTVHAVGTLAVEAGTDIPLEYYILMDDVRSVATETKIRLTHTHPSVGNVDIYVTADGNIDAATPTFSDVPYKATTGFVALVAGEYNVKVTPTGAKSPVAIDTGMLMLEAGKVYSAAAINAPNSTPQNLLLMDAFKM